MPKANLQLRFELDPYRYLRTTFTYFNHLAFPDWVPPFQRSLYDNISIRKRERRGLIQHPLIESFIDFKFRFDHFDLGFTAHALYNCHYLNIFTDLVMYYKMER